MANGRKNIFVKVKETVQKLATNPSFTLKEQLGYAGGSFGSSMGQDMVGTFITLFLTKYVGIQAAMVGTLMLVTKILTIIADPVLGGMLDRGIGPDKKSLTRPFLLLSPFPLVVSSILLYVVPGLNMTLRIVWVFCFYIIYSLSVAMFSMSMMTMSVRMTRNPNDRKNFFTIAQFASSLGTTLPGGIIPIFISMYKNDFSAQGKIYFLGALIFGVVGFVAMLMPYFTLREKNRAVSIAEPKVKLNLKAILVNKPLLLLIASNIVESVRQICYGALAFFYNETLGAFWLSTVIGAISVTLSYIGILLVPFIGKKLSSRSMLVYSYLYSGICYAILLITGYKSLFLVGVLLSISGFPNGLMGVARNMLLVDSTEYMEWKTWKKYGTPVRSDGMVMAVNSMAGKVNSLWKELLLPAGLTLIGYVSAQVIDGQTIEVTQSPETLRGIFLLVAVPGLVGNLIPGIIMMFDNYTGKRKEAILAELAQIHADLEAKQAAEAAEAAALSEAVPAE